MIGSVSNETFCTSFLKAFHEEKTFEICSYVKKLKQSISKEPIPCPLITSIAWQGGGPKGVAYIGVIKSLEQYKVLASLQAVAGSSAGAITALFLALGFDAEQSEKFFKINLCDILDLRESYFGLSFSEYKIKKLLDWKFSYVYSGKSFHRVVKVLIEFMLGDAHATFSDLANKILEGGDPLLKNLIITGTTENNDPIVFSNETTPNARIADAVIASMSLPPLFPARTVKQRNGANIFQVKDGGIRDNFPINLLDEGVALSSNYKVSFQPYDGQKYPVNPSVMGVALMDLHDINPHLSSVPTLIQKLLTDHEHANKFSRWRTFFQIVTNTFRVLNKFVDRVKKGKFLDLLFVWYYSQYGKAEPENVARELALHVGSIVQIYHAGVSTFDFHLSSKQRNILISNGLNTSDVVLRTLMDPTKSYEPAEDFNFLQKDCLREELPEHILKFIEELEKYRDNIKSHQIDRLHDNVRLQFLAKYIMKIISQGPENAQEIMKNSLKVAKTKYDEKKNLIKMQHQKREKIVNERMIIQQLISYAKENNHKNFKMLFRAQLTKTLDLAKCPIGKEGNLLQVVIVTKNVTILQAMLKILKTNIDLLKQQNRASKYLNEDGDLVACYSLADYLNNKNNFPHSPLFIAIDANNIDCLRELLEHGADLLLGKDFDSHVFWSLLPEIQNENTAFHYAIRKNNYDAFKALYTWNPIGFCRTRFGKSGDTLLHTMLKCNQLFALRALQDPDFWEEKADWDIKNGEYMSCRQLVASQKTCVDFGVCAKQNIVTEFISTVEHFFEKLN